MAKRNIRGRLFFSKWFYMSLGAVASALALGQYIHLSFVIGLIALGLLTLLVLIDALALFATPGEQLKARRILDDKLSNGDLNDISIILENHYPQLLDVEVIDELPYQFQHRNFSIRLKLAPRKQQTLTYQVRPTERGEYQFGAVNVLVQSPIHFIIRRFTFSQHQQTKVYPAFKEMRQFEMMAISNRLTEFGIKKVRRIGHQMEFDQIRDYTKGDDYRTINWKATARRSHLMVNQYQEEKSQQVISVINMGRSMKMPFEGLTLLDYAINTSLVISKIAMMKHDKAGLLTFNDQLRHMVKPQRSGKQMQTIMEALYNAQTDFQEQSMQVLYQAIKTHVRQRSLLLVFTNFESLSSAKRQVTMLQQLAHNHLVVVVFFENTELKQLTTSKAKDMEGIYIKTIAEKFAFDKKLIVRELERHGVHTILTEPGNLTVNTINKYLELKARGLI